MTDTLDGWRQVRAKYLYRVIDERAGNEALPLLAVSIHHGVVPRQSLTDDEPRADDLSAYKRCAAGDMVINRMRAFQGAVGVAPQAGIVSPDYLVLRLVSDVDVRFFHHLFRSAWFVGEMTARLRGIGGSDQGNVRTPRINVEEFGEIPLTIPSREEQRTIAGFLDRETARTDKLVNKKRQIIDLHGERQQALVDSLLAEFPTEPLKHVAAIKISNVDKLAVEGQDAILLCNYTDVYNNREISSDLRFMHASATREQIRKFELRAGDVLITKDSELSDDIGVPAYVPGDLPGVLCGYHLAVLRPRPGRVDGGYLYWALRSLRVRQQFSVAATGVTRFGLRADAIGATRIPLPSYEIQRALAEKLRARQSTVDRVTAALGRQIALLRERREATIADAVTGQLELAKVAA